MSVRKKYAFMSIANSFFFFNDITFLDTHLQAYLEFYAFIFVKLHSVFLNSFSLWTYTWCQKLYLSYLLIEVVTAIFMLSMWRHFRRDVFKGLKAATTPFSASWLPVAVSKFENHLPSYVEGQKTGSPACVLCLNWSGIIHVFSLKITAIFTMETKKKVLLYISIVELREFSSLSELKGLIRFSFNVRSWLQGI